MELRSSRRTMVGTKKPFIKKSAVGIYRYPGIRAKESIRRVVVHGSCRLFFYWADVSVVDGN